jgi:hypothetical protein
MDHEEYVKVLFVISALANEHHLNPQWPLLNKPVRTRQGKQLIETIFFQGNSHLSNILKSKHQKPTLTVI